MKRCSKCGLDKTEDAYSGDRTKADWLSSTCKVCKSEYKRQWQAANRVKARAYKRRHKDKVAEAKQPARRARTIELRQRNEARRIAIDVGKVFRRLMRPIRERMARQAWKKANPDRVRQSNAKRRDRANAWRRDRYQTDLQFKLTKIMRVAVRKTLMNKQASTFDLLGYTLEALRARLEATMPAGYGWADFLAGKLHVDHIRPVAAFTFTAATDPQFAECWALDNLQLLPGDENCRKNDLLPNGTRGRALARKLSTCHAR